ncbi:MAG TPA: hypothetical protein VJO33_03405, partial [Gemmatimonadaceae bacterium]|nr:hypothetical protein [Gemmatimonadaceae bacterium]
RAPNAVARGMAIFVALTAVTVVAGIVWARRRSRQMPQRFLTGAAATIVFHMWWFSVAYALIAKH